MILYARYHYFIKVSRYFTPVTSYFTEYFAVKIIIPQNSNVLPKCMNCMELNCIIIAHGESSCLYDRLI